MMTFGKMRDLISFDSKCLQVLFLVLSSLSWLIITGYLILVRGPAVLLPATAVVAGVVTVCAFSLISPAHADEPKSDLLLRLLGAILFFTPMLWIGNLTGKFLTVLLYLIPLAFGLWFRWENEREWRK